MSLRHRLIDKKSKLFSKVNQSEAFIEVHSMATYYPRKVRVYVPNTSFLKIRPELELIKDHEYEPERIGKNENEETDLERSVRRTKKAIFDYILCNEFNLFATFTFANDRQNIENCKSRMANWLKNEQKRKGNFKYLIVSEFHKDNESLHFHGVFQDYKGKVSKVYINNKPLKQRGGKQVYQIPSYTIGHNNAKLLLDETARMKSGFYIQKYITKDMPLLFGKNRYWASMGLKKPKIEYNPQNWFKIAKPDRIYKTEHGKFLEFDIGNNAIIDTFIEANS